MPAEQAARGADDHRQDERGGEAGEGQHQLPDAADAAWREGFHQDSDHGGAKDHQHRRQLVVLDVRGRDRRGRGKCRDHGVAPFTAVVVAGVVTVGGGSVA